LFAPAQCLAAVWKKQAVACLSLEMKVIVASGIGETIVFGGGSKHDVAGTYIGRFYREA
jgi:hypothetical protein